jgi:hypothetical protein
MMRALRWGWDTFAARSGARQPPGRSRYSTAELRLLAAFVEACRDLQARHAARLIAEFVSAKRR